LTVARILVADDDPNSLELVQVYLESKGYEVSGASDGNRAVELSESGEFDLLILDVHMPLFDGVEVLQMLRKRFIQHPIKIIALTADAGSGLLDELVREGIDGYLTKPVSLAELGEEITRVLAR
jgi:CheY-like chemotaxis protein